MTHRYCRDAVDTAIAAHNRRPRGGRIGAREAKLIHALLKGRTGAKPSTPLPTSSPATDEN